MARGYDNDVHIALLMSDASGQDLSDFRDALLRFTSGDAVFYVKVKNIHFRVNFSPLLLSDW